MPTRSKAYREQYNDTLHTYKGWDKFLLLDHLDRLNADVTEAWNDYNIVLATRDAIQSLCENRKISKRHIVRKTSAREG